MKIIKQHIAVLLLLLMGFSLVPYNVLHHHEEDMHYASLLQHDNNDHHCDLDAYFCQDGFAKKCEHPSHISQSQPDCFSCQYHFIKQYQSSVFSVKNVFTSSPFEQSNFFGKLICTIIPLAANKGPPTAA